MVDTSSYLDAHMAQDLENVERLAKKHARLSINSSEISHALTEDV
jgi:hypothetical protein